MSRLRRIENYDRIFFVTTNLRTRIKPFDESERDIIAGQLQRQRSGADFLLFGYVAMPTHVHLLMRPRNLGLSESMQNFKRSSAYKINELRHAQGSLWQARYYDFVLRRVRDFWDKFDYIHNNPVEAGLVAAPTEWKWSSAADYERLAKAPSTIDPVDFPADRNALLWPAPWRRA